jgi:DUF4097 and DUF4098 domain-containing protein YvlB
MKTKPTLLATTVALALLPLMTEAQNRQNGRSINIESGRPVTSCNDLMITYDRRPAITEETEMTLPQLEVSALQAQTSDGGIYVTGWDRHEYSVTTCKAVPADDPDAPGTLRQITATNAKGRISVAGPVGRDWMANLVVRVPRVSALTLQTTNGPLQLRDVAGSIHVNASNGPVSLKNVAGSVRASTVNGPISIGLSGSRWDGPGLEAATQNGPLAVSIPDAYGSGIRIQTSGHSPVSCKAPACAGSTRSLSSPGIIQIGNGDPSVRLSTINGPLSIQAARD